MLMLAPSLPGAALGCCPPPSGRPQVAGPSSQDFRGVGCNSTDKLKITGCPAAQQRASSAATGGRYRATRGAQSDACFSSVSRCQHLCELQNMQENSTFCCFTPVSVTHPRSPASHGIAASLETMARTLAVVLCAMLSVASVSAVVSGSAAQGAGAPARISRSRRSRAAAPRREAAAPLTRRPARTPQLHPRLRPNCTGAHGTAARAESLPCQQAAPPPQTSPFRALSW